MVLGRELKRIRERQQSHSLIYRYKIELSGNVTDAQPTPEICHQNHQARTCLTILSTAFNLVKNYLLFTLGSSDLREVSVRLCMGFYLMCSQLRLVSVRPLIIQESSCLANNILHKTSHPGCIQKYLLNILSCFLKHTYNVPAWNCQKAHVWSQHYDASYDATELISRAFVAVILLWAVVKAMCSSMAAGSPVKFVFAMIWGENLHFCHLGVWYTASDNPTQEHPQYCYGSMHATHNLASILTNISGPPLKKHACHLT